LNIRKALSITKQSLADRNILQAVWRDRRLPGDRATAEEHLDAAIQWLCRAQDAAQGGGVSYGFSLRGGWQPPYPETTGSIIPTFLRYAERSTSRLGDSEAQAFIKRAERMAHWLTSLQMDNGALPGGTTAIKPVPTVFNTGQILQGWVYAYKQFNDEAILKSLIRAANWLVEVQDEDGCWRRGLSPLTLQTPATYNVRSAVGLLEAGQLIDEANFRKAAIRNFDWALTQQRENGWFENNCLTNLQQPLTHTIGYTLEGLLEAAIILHNENYLAAVIRASKHLKNVVHEDGFLAGRLNAEWQPQADWCCLTGSSQIALVWLKLARYLGNNEYLEAAKRLLSFVKRTQQIAPPSEADIADELMQGTTGGIKGSHPVWGDYDRFVYPNWAAKFFADAIMVEQYAPERIASGGEKVSYTLSH
jgi:hypothetical protein